MAEQTILIVEDDPDIRDGVRILLTAICVHVLHLGLTAVWCCMALDNVTRAVLLGIRFFRGKWKKTLQLAA